MCLYFNEIHCGLNDLLDEQFASVYPGLHRQMDVPLSRSIQLPCIHGLTRRQAGAEVGSTVVVSGMGSVGHAGHSVGAGGVGQ